MSNALPWTGSATVTVPASSAIACYSDAPYTVTNVTAYANVPSTETVLFSGKGSFTSSTFTTPATLQIRGADGAPLWYSVGTAPAVAERMVDALPAPSALDVTGTITPAMILGGILTSAAAAVTGTLATGAVMDAATTMAVGDVIRWSVIKVGANTFTMAPAASGHTYVGATAVATATSAAFVTRKTAAATFITYRVS